MFPSRPEEPVQIGSGSVFPTVAIMDPVVIPTNAMRKASGIGNSAWRGELRASHAGGRAYDYGAELVLLVHYGLVALFLPASALDKIVSFTGATEQAKQVFSSDEVAAAPIPMPEGAAIATATRYTPSPTRM
jgi:hypothetical protein